MPSGADGFDPRQVRLVPRDGEWQAHLMCEVPIAEKAPGEGVGAIDVGIVNMAAVVYSDGTTELYSGGELLAQEYYLAKEIAKCKPSGWKPGSRKKAASRQERKLHQTRARRRKQFLHTVTRHIVDNGIEKGIGTIVLGDLKGIREHADGKDRNWGRAGNLKLHTWPFNTFAQMLAYKEKLAGITPIRRSEPNTSRMCSACGHLDASSRVYRGLYLCSECDATINADINGAVNILHKYLQGLDGSAEPSTGVPVRVGDLPTIWPEPLVNRYDWDNPNPLVRVAGSVLAGKTCR